MNLKVYSHQTHASLVTYIRTNLKFFHGLPEEFHAKLQSFLAEALHNGHEIAIISKKHVPPSIIRLWLKNVLEQYVTPKEVSRILIRTKEDTLEEQVNYICTALKAGERYVFISSDKEAVNKQLKRNRRSWLVNTKGQKPDFSAGFKILHLLTQSLAQVDVVNNFIGQYANENSTNFASLSFSEKRTLLLNELSYESKKRSYTLSKLACLLLEEDFINQICFDPIKSASFFKARHLGCTVLPIK